MPLSLSEKYRLALGTGMGLVLVAGGAASEAADPVRVDYATTQVIAAGDSPAVIAEKAGKVLPRPNQ